MEKPSPKYDRTLPLSATSKEDAAQKERYFDRMTLRGIPVLRDTEEQDQAPTWRGDHTFSSDAASYSLSHFIEPEVAREHPDWVQEQVSQVAAQRFEQRLAQDLSYEHKESVHEESVVRWQPIQTSTGVWELATQYGDSMVTLAELWEHTREYAQFAGNPAAYNEQEHRAQIQMQEELISGGAHGFVSVLSHPDAVRYVQVWQKTEDGSIVSKQVDLFKTTGRDFSHDEGTKLIDNLAQYFKEDVGGGEASVISYAHIYIHEKEVAEDDIRTIAIAQVMEMHGSSDTSAERYMPRAMVQVGEKAARDTTESMVQLGVFLREHIDKKIAAFTKRDVDGKKPGRTTLIVDARNASETPTPERNIFVHAADPQVSNKTHDALRTTDAMKSLEADWWIIRSMIVHKDSFSAAPSAILFWLSESANMHALEMHADTAPVHIEKDPVREPTKMQKIGASIRNAFSLLWGDHNGKHIPLTHEGDASMSVIHVDAHPRMKKEEDAQLFLRGETNTEPLSLSRVDLLLAVLRKIVMQDALIWVYRRPVLHDTKTHEFDTPHTGIFFLREERQDEQAPLEIELQHTRQLSVAIIIWWLTEYSRHTFKKPNETIMEDGVDAGSLDVREDENTSSPWLLLAIVWYLTAIREHGKRSVVHKKSTGKKQSKQTSKKIHPSLPLTGVIFTFGS